MCVCVLTVMCVPVDICLEYALRVHMRVGHAGVWTQMGMGDPGGDLPLPCAAESLFCPCEGGLPPACLPWSLWSQGWGSPSQSRCPWGLLWVPENRSQLLGSVLLVLAWEHLCTQPCADQRTGRQPHGDWRRTKL